MARVVVVGDSRVGKTAFAHVACGHPLPVNIFRSTEVETFYLHGTDQVATLQVVPGTALDDVLARTCGGADAIMVIYDSHTSIYTAKRWLQRIEQLMDGTGRVPILICSHSSGSADPRVHDRRLSYVLQQYPHAEHTRTRMARPAGIVDCANRVVHHIRRRHPSPLSHHSDGGG